MDTKDITNLRIDLQNRADRNAKAKAELFQFEADKKREQQQTRLKLEQAFEREKSKVSIFSTCFMSRFHTC